MNEWSARNALWLTVLLLVVAFMGIALGGTMGPRVVEQKEFSIIGIKTRTNNAKETTGQAVIPKQWDKFFKEGILAKIPNKADPTVFAIYTNYQSDRNGDYDFIIGAKVSAVSTVPPGMVMKTVPKGRYAVLTSSKGAVQKIVPEAWQKVYSLEDQSELGGSRAYTADFELYDQRSQNPQDSQVDIYIGIQ